MVQSYRTSHRFEQEAQRCERLGLAVYDAALQSQLLGIAREYRARAERLRQGHAA